MFAIYCYSHVLHIAFSEHQDFLGDLKYGGYDPTLIIDTYHLIFGESPENLKYQNRGDT
jgi:hypothetical protein